MKQTLRTVADTYEPYSEPEGYKQMEKLREVLLRAAVRHVREGKSGHEKDRVRAASDATGIPCVFIEIALKK